MASGSRLATVIGLGAVSLALVMALALFVGPQQIDYMAAWQAPFSASPDAVLVFRVRLPRIVLGAVAGAALGGVGASLQALLRNPLADPYVLGTSGGAALGGTLSLVLAGSASHILALPLGAFAGALGATVLVYGIARASSALSITGMLLAGIVVNAFAAACITLIKLLVSAMEAQELLFWLVGAIGYEDWSTLLTLLIYVVIGLVILVALTGRMNLLSLGDKAAAHLGIDLVRIKWTIFLATALVVGAVVAFCGMIGFVGLVVPHGIRLVFGADHRVVVPASVFAGGGFLVLADLLARAMFDFAGTEAPVGAVTAIIGCPVFLWLLLRKVHQPALV